MQKQCCAAQRRVQRCLQPHRLLGKGNGTALPAAGLAAAAADRCSGIPCNRQLLPPIPYTSSPGSRLLRLEGQRCSVHAEAQAGGGRSVLKYMAQVAQAARAAHLQGR